MVYVVETKCDKEKKEGGKESEQENWMVVYLLPFLETPLHLNKIEGRTPK
jgi:hypothetical protein